MKLRREGYHRGDDEGGTRTQEGESKFAIARRKNQCTTYRETVDTI